jgi:hypothetical protein
MKDEWGFWPDMDTGKINAACLSLPSPFTSLQVCEKSGVARNVVSIHLHYLVALKHLEKHEGKDGVTWSVRKEE